MTAHEEMLSEMDLVAVEEDGSSSVLELYDGMSDFSDTDLTAEAQKLLADSDIADAIAEIAESLSDSDTVLRDTFFGQYNITVEEMPLGDIIAASEYQDQFGILTPRVSKILADKEIGLLRTFCMFQPIKLVRYSGTMRVMGGHHRSSTLVWLMNWGSAIPENVMAQKIPVIVFDIVDPLLVGNEKTEEQAALRLIAQFWSTDNGSRSVTKEERSQYKFLKQGVSATSLDDIVDSRIMKPSEKLQLIARIIWSDYILDSKSESVATLDLSPDVNSGVSLTVQTVSKLMASFYSNLKKVKVAIPYTTRDGEESTKESSKWAKDLDDSELFAEWCELIITPRNGKKSMLERALVEQCRIESSTNISRDISTGGRILAEMFDAATSPRHVVKSKSPKSASKKTNLPRRVR